ncbi:IS200/IS605 family transposase [Psychrobacter sp. UBA3962]|uniref:IS200/IS605 family transposase n=1 Tax=Psychrobacter sp. UBA3962 TaxID=1947352 RepID=UPI0025E77366|nr:IS200/IS605 family transposase [Psychrobacter sp. UBA3962]
MSRLLKSHYNSIYRLTYHFVVLVTKNGRKCFTGAMLDRLKEIITNLCQKWEVGLLEFNGEADHVHLLIEMHPNIMPSKFINNLKTVTSRLMRKEFAEHLAEFYSERVLWTRAYCLLTTGGATIDTIRQYIEKQERPD